MRLKRHGGLCSGVPRRGRRGFEAQLTQYGRALAVHRLGHELFDPEMRVSSTQCTLNQDGGIIRGRCRARCSTITRLGRRLCGLRRIFASGRLDDACSSFILSMLALPCLADGRGPSPEALQNNRGIIERVWVKMQPFVLLSKLIVEQTSVSSRLLR